MKKPSSSSIRKGNSFASSNSKTCDRERRILSGSSISALAPDAESGTFTRMPIITIVCGIILDLIGSIGFVATGMRSWTALIPSILGTILLLLGIFSLIKPKIRKHLMHVAALVGVVALLGSGMRLVKSLAGGAAASDAAVMANGLTAGVALVFLILCVKSFADARRKRLSGPQG